MSVLKASFVFVVMLVSMMATAADVFTTLPLCLRVEGEAQVRLPKGEWTEAEEGKFYPLGTSYRVGKKSHLVVAFGRDSSVTIGDGTEFGTRVQALGEKTRTVVLVRGTLDFKLADNLPEGVFFVAAPGFVVKNPAGESKVVYEDVGDGDKATVRCVTGSLGVEGRHFAIPAMRAADELVVRTSHDHLSTILYGTSGDYVVRLDQGVCALEDIDDNGQKISKIEKRETEWHLSPSTKVVINRSVPAIGERMSVHTMAFDAAGELKSECSFCEGRAEVNSGELVAKEKMSEEELAKRAAEATETTEAADVEGGESAPAEKSSDSENNSNEE